jgi:hypothetical protein
MFRKRRNQRVQVIVVQSSFGKRDNVYVESKLSSKAVNDRGLPGARSPIQEVAAAERNPPVSIPLSTLYEVTGVLKKEIPNPIIEYDRVQRTFGA